MTKSIDSSIFSGDNDNSLEALDNSNDVES